MSAASLQPSKPTATDGSEWSGQFDRRKQCRDEECDEAGDVESKEKDEVEGCERGQGKVVNLADYKSAGPDALNASTNNDEPSA